MNCLTNWSPTFKTIRSKPPDHVADDIAILSLRRNELILKNQYFTLDHSIQRLCV